MRKALDPAKYNSCESYPHFLHIVIYKKPGLTHQKILLDPEIRWYIIDDNRKYRGKYFLRVKGESGTQYVRFLFYTLLKRMKKAGRDIYEDFNT